MTCPRHPTVTLTCPRCAAEALAQKGGAARAKSLTPAQRSVIASKAAKARWQKKEQGK